MSVNVLCTEREREESGRFPRIAMPRSVCCSQRLEGVLHVNVAMDIWMQRWNVIPAPAGIQHTGTAWIPAYAGMTAQGKVTATQLNWLPAYAGMTIWLRARYVSTPECITRSRMSYRRTFLASRRTPYH
jgi:hypothetical protein